MDRLEAFEKMLKDIQRQAEYENEKLQELKAAGKEKTATYRQLFANRFMLEEMVSRLDEADL